MKRISSMITMIAIVVAAFALGTSPAEATGFCQTVANVPNHFSSTVRFSGNELCDVQHTSLTINVYAQRRPGNQTGSFTSWGPFAFETNGPNYSVGDFVDTPYDCNKDYRTYATGSASPGGHSGVDVSSILQNTC